MKKKVFLSCVALLFLSACSPVSTLYTWKANDYHGFSYKNILVLSVAERKAYSYFTRTLENSVVDAFKTRDIKAIAVSATPLIVKQYPDSTDLNNLAVQNGCDAVLIVTLQDSRIERNYNGGLYMGWGFFGWGTPLVSDENILYFETRLIDLKTQKIAYLFNSSVGLSDIKYTSQSFAESIITQLMGVPPKKNKKEKTQSK